jgi:hypothetical protein
MLSKGTEDCEICKIIRWYLMIGVPIIVLLWSRPDFVFLRGYMLANIVGSGITIALILVVVWKYYQEFWRK